MYVRHKYWCGSLAHVCALAGDEIMVVDDAEGPFGWWRGFRKGVEDQVGQFPSNFVRHVNSL